MLLESTTAWVVLATAALALATAVVGYLKIHKGVQEIHVMVNSRLEAEQDWNDRLSAALQNAGIQVPPRPPRS
jgi:hypothetical protein